jgi:hypothetical protein
VKGRRATLRRDGTRPVDVVVTAEDNLGRKFEARAHATAPVLINGHAEITYWQTLAEWDFDGSKDGHGDIAETFSRHKMRKRLRSLPDRPGFGRGPDVDRESRPAR